MKLDVQSGVESYGCVRIEGLTADDLNNLRALGALPAHARVSIKMPALEYRRRQSDGSLPEGPVMQFYDLRPELDHLRALDEDDRMAVAIQPLGSLRSLVQDIENRVDAVLGRVLFGGVVPDRRFRYQSLDQES